jgi:hypothetical protein
MKTSTLKISIELQEGLRQVSKKSGIKIEILTAEAIKMFLKNNEHFKGVTK